MLTGGLGWEKGVAGIGLEPDTNGVALGLLDTKGVAGMGLEPDTGLLPIILS